MLIYLMQSKMLVTGGAGFMGSAFIRHLFTKPGFTGKIVNLDLLTYAGNLDNLKRAEGDARYSFVKGDIGDEALLKKLFEEEEFDLVVHFAAETHVDRSIAHPKRFLETNILGTANLLEMLRLFPGVHFHHISTDEVYGSLGQEGLFLETSRYLPNSPYSASKAGADHLVRSYGKTYNLSTTISHASNNYGPCQFPEKFIPLMILHCLEERPLPVYGTGENVRDWLYVEDHAEAVMQILEKGKRGEIYNIGGGNEWRNIDLLHLLLEEFAQLTSKEKGHYEKLITFVPDRPGHDHRYALDLTKMRTEIDWASPHNMRRGLSKTIRWYLDNPEWLERVQTGEYQEWLDKQYATL